MNTTERRNFFRLSVDIPVKVLYNSQDEFRKTKLFYGSIRDLSGGGLRIRTNADLPDKEKVNLRFMLPYNILNNSVQDFFVSAEILRSKKIENKKIYEYGAKFVNISPGIQDKIIKYLFDLQISAKLHLKEVTST